MVSSSPLISATIGLVIIIFFFTVLHYVLQFYYFVNKAEVSPSSNQQEIPSQCASQYTGTKKKEIQTSRYIYADSAKNNTQSELDKYDLCYFEARPHTTCTWGCLNILHGILASSYIFFSRIVNNLHALTVYCDYCVVICSLVVCVQDSSVTYYFFTGTEPSETKEKVRTRRPVYKDSNHKNTAKDQSKSADKDRHKHHKHKSKHKHSKP